MDVAYIIEFGENIWPFLTLNRILNDKSYIFCEEFVLDTNASEILSQSSNLSKCLRHFTLISSNMPCFYWYYNTKEKGLSIKM